MRIEQLPSPMQLPHSRYLAIALGDFVTHARISHEAIIHSGLRQIVRRHRTQCIKKRIENWRWRTRMRRRH